MKIVESNINMAAERQFSLYREQRLSIRSESPRPEVEISSEAKAAQETSEIDPEAALENDPRLAMIKQLIEALTGRSIDLRPLKLRDPDQVTQAAPPPQAAEGGFAVDYREVLEESESVNFAASGVIRTADGREIAFHAEIAMNRQYREEFSFSAASGSLAREQKDPLVLNYAASAATLSEQTFTFDLDADGQDDQIAMLRAGSAYLALDRNADARINDGSELFGTKSGDGFADLAAFDQDRNNWIDENDAVFAQLRLWIKDESGADRLMNLQEMGVGAIYLGRAQTDFSLTDQQNRQLGQIRSTGIYLQENGGVRSIQQVDLNV